MTTNRCRGDVPAVLRHYIALAQFYEQQRDYKARCSAKRASATHTLLLQSCKHFHGKCLDLALASNDVMAEMTAQHNLGISSALAGDVEQCIAHHLRHRELARSTPCAV